MGIDESKLRKNEKWENLTISNDFMFSKVMQDKEICKETLEILLDKKIGNIKYVETQKVIDIGHDEKSVRLDAYVEDEEILYDIEMQVVKDTDISKRSRFYQVIMDADSLNKGDVYGDLKKIL